MIWQEVYYLMRFASSYTAIPSIHEACSLVAMENLALGSLPFTSYVEGLRDTCRPLNTANSKNFNAISFFLDPKNNQKTKAEIQIHIRLLAKSSIFDSKPRSL